MKTLWLFRETLELMKNLCVCEIVVKMEIVVVGEREVINLRRVKNLKTAH
jgi:hypothetical protein